MYPGSNGLLKKVVLHKMYFRKHEIPHIYGHQQPVGISYRPISLYKFISVYIFIMAETYYQPPRWIFRTHFTGGCLFFRAEISQQESHGKLCVIAEKQLVTLLVSNCFCQAQIISDPDSAGLLIFINFFKFCVNCIVATR